VKNRISKHRCPEKKVTVLWHSSLAAVASLLIACTSPTSKPEPQRPTKDQLPGAISLTRASSEFGFAIFRRRTQSDIAPFAITRTPITVAQYKGCVDAGACSTPELTAGACSSPAVPVVEGPTYSADSSANDLPVTCAHPRQAAEYCAWVGGTLPTIEEWHHAARGPTVQRFSWGNNLPDCTKHPRALPVAGDQKGCCLDDGCDPSTYYAVAQRLEGASSTGLLDVLLTPAELVRGSKDSSVPACDDANGACAVQGLVPGAIDYVVHFSSDTAQSDHMAAYGFRCAFEVKP
jgi:hypothetical protein